MFLVRSLSRTGPVGTRREEGTVHYDRGLPSTTLDGEDVTSLGVPVSNLDLSSRKKDDLVSFWQRPSSGNRRGPSGGLGCGRVWDPNMYFWEVGILLLSSLSLTCEQKISPTQSNPGTGV